MRIENRIPEEIRGPLFYLGLALVLFGAMALIYLAISVVQILKSPSESSIVQWTLTTVAESELILKGHVDERTFEFHATEPFQYLFLCFLGLIVVSLLSGIFSGLLKGGLELIRFSQKDNKQKSGGSGVNPVISDRQYH